MIEKSHAGSRNARTRTSKQALSPIPEPFQLICASTVTAGTRKIKIPMLVLRGEWLKRSGFRSARRFTSRPIGAAKWCCTGLV